MAWRGKEKIFYETELRTVGNLYDCKSVNDIRKYFFEKLYYLQDDIDMIYDKYFSPMLDLVYKGNLQKKEHTDYTYTTISSSDLTSKHCIDANSSNPVVIRIGVFSDGNYYDPKNSVVSLSLHSYIVDSFLFGNGWETALQDANSDKAKERGRNIMTDTAIKTSIYHELSHWIRDSLDNQSVRKAIKNRKAQIDSKVEIDAQVHVISLLHQMYKEEWDSLTLLDLMQLKPALRVPFRTTKDNKKRFNQYQKDLLTRLNREGILGKNMKPITKRSLKLNERIKYE